MDTLDLIDPAARDLARAFADMDPTRQTLERYRASLEAVMTGGVPTPPVRSTVLVAPGGDDRPDVRLLMYRPSGRSGTLPVIYFIHASGFIAGRPEWMAAANQSLADETGAAVVAVSYRLAPEASFPAPLEDCYNGLRWIERNAASLEVDGARIVVCGESAGGGLAAALALLARDRGEVSLIGQVLTYPMLDPRTGTTDAPDENPLAGEFVWTRRHNRFAWEAMRGGREVREGELGYFAPALAGDLVGLPPAFIAVGALDLFAEEDARYAMRLASAGVPVELHVYQGGIHGFDVTGGEIASRYQTERRGALVRLLGSSHD